MKIYLEIPFWLGLYSGDPRAGGIAVPGSPRGPQETWELLPNATYANTDTMRFHLRLPSPDVTHGALFEGISTAVPLPNLVYPLAQPFPVVPGRDLAVRPGNLVVKYVLPDSRRPFGRGPFGVSLFGRWPAQGDTLGIANLVLDTLFEAAPLACGGRWPALVGEAGTHAP